MKVKIQTAKVWKNRRYLKLHTSWITKKTIHEFIRTCITRKVYGKKWDIALIRGEFLKIYFYIWLSPLNKLQRFCNLRDTKGKAYPAFSIGILGIGFKICR